MARPIMDVRRAGAGDVEDLLQLWVAAREEVSRSTRALGGMSPEQVRPRLRTVLAGDDIQVIMARWEGCPAGYAVLRLAPLAPMVEGQALHVEHLFVLPDMRRHGVARGLLTAVVGLAERLGADQVVSSAPQGNRDTHRFLARLGFSPMVVRRVAATTVLRRRLAGESRRGSLDDLLSRRRSLRARAGGRRGDARTDARTDADRWAEPATDLDAGEPADAASTRERPAAEGGAVRAHDTLEMPTLREPHPA